jgi:hypothetical protein
MKIQYASNQQDAFFADISAIAKQIQTLHTQATVEYVQIVEGLIRSKCKDVNRIALTLDYMLDFASDERVLNMYRKLCHYLYILNPQVATEYIQFWKEQYDEDEEMYKSGYFKKKSDKIGFLCANCVYIQKEKEAVSKVILGQFLCSKNRLFICS